MKYYLDTAIWRDYYENRSDKFRPLGEWALMLIKKIIEDEDLIIYSDWIVEELERKYNKDMIVNIFEVANKENILIKVKKSVKQIKEATNICKTRKVPFMDVLHTIIARDENAVMVTRDRHFECLQDIANIKKPEELI